MNVTAFLILLSAFSAISSLATEGIKNIAGDKNNLPYNIIALIIALLTGCGGMAAYYQLNDIPFTANHVISMIFMGLASGLVSMTSYDKVKQGIEQITRKKR